MVISSALVLLGFFVVFYSSAVDLATTYLPERLVKFSIPVGFAGWAVYSLTAGNWAPLTSSIWLTALSFTVGYVLYRAKHWASGDMWLMGVSAALLGPAFPTFWPDFYIYSAVWAGIMGVCYYFFFLFKHGIYKDYVPELVFLAGVSVVSLVRPVYWLMITSMALIFLIVRTQEEVEALFVIEKDVKDLEVDDWLTEDLDLGETVLLASKPVGPREVELARKHGKGRTKIRSGVPLTPAFSLALLSLLAFGLP